MKASHEAWFQAMLGAVTNMRACHRMVAPERKQAEGHAMPRLGGVNLLGVLLAALAVWALGFVWYGWVFDEAWMAGQRFEMAENEGQGPAWTIAGAVIALVLSFGIGWLIKRADVAGPGPSILFSLVIGGLIGLPLMGFTLVYSPWHSLNLFAIHGGHTLASFALAGLVLSFFD